MSTRYNGEQKRVYFAQATWGGPIKIGCSYNVANRIQTLAGPLPFDLVEIGSFRGVSFHEQYLHAWFHKNRIRGEWFQPSDDLWRCALQARTHGSVDFVPHESISRPRIRFDEYPRMISVWRIKPKTFSDFLDTSEENLSRLLKTNQVAPMKWLAAFCAAVRKTSGREYNIDWHQLTHSEPEVVAA